jgi:hypothetical protein
MVQEMGTGSLVQVVILQSACAEEGKDVYDLRSKFIGPK